MLLFCLHRRKIKSEIFMDYINRLREKPNSTKKAIAFATSGVVTLAIFGLWVTVFRFSINANPPTITASVANSESNDVNPLSAFWSLLSEGWGGLSENISQLSNGTAEKANFISELSASTSTINTTEPTVSVAQKDVLILDSTSTDKFIITQ